MWLFFNARSFVVAAAAAALHSLRVHWNRKQNENHWRYSKAESVRVWLPVVQISYTSIRTPLHLLILKCLCAVYSCVRCTTYDNAWIYLIKVQSSLNSFNRNRDESRYSHDSIKCLTIDCCDYHVIFDANVVGLSWLPLSWG